MGNDNNMGCELVGMLDIKGKDQWRRVYSTDGIAPTLVTCGGGQQQVKIFDTRRLRVRKLTPKEYGILQAFPMENWKQVVSDSQAYKQFGNAVTTTVFTPIAEEIKKAILQSESEEISMEANKKETSGLEDAMNATIAEDEPKTTEATAAAVGADTAAVEAQAEAGQEEDEEEMSGGNIPVGEMAEFIAETLFNETLIPGILYEKIKESVLQTLKQEFDGKTIGEPKEIKRDWEAAENAVNDILSKYAPGGYMGKVIYPVLMPLKERLEGGERTVDLFNAIVEATR